jgi:SAM-dependent methyltransferase
MSSAPKVGFAFSTKERVEFSKRSLATVDSDRGFDLVWCDGSDSPEARALPDQVQLRNTRIVEVNRDVRGGPDAAIKFGLRRLLALGYDYCGLIENDIVFEPGWFAKLMGLFDLARADGFQPGAATVRVFKSRVLEFRQGYSLIWCAGAAMVLFTREAAEEILRNYLYNDSWQIYAFNKHHLGFDLRDVWELWMDQPQRALGYDWSFASTLYKVGLVCVGANSSPATNLEEDLILYRQCMLEYLKEAEVGPVTARLQPHFLHTGDCPACGQPTHRLWSARSWRYPLTFDRFGYAECDACASLFCTPRPTTEQVRTLRSESIPPPPSVPLPLARLRENWRWQRTASLLADNQLTGGRLLEVGCGHGFFLRQAQSAGWECFGADLPSTATRHAREQLGLKVFETDLLSSPENLPDSFGTFDLIVLTNFLEHAADPAAILKAVAGWLKPGGKILLTVPNAAASSLQAQRENWVLCREPYINTVHFTPAGLDQLLTRVGLTRVACAFDNATEINLSSDQHLSPRILRLHRRWKKSRPQLAASILQTYQQFVHFRNRLHYWRNEAGHTSENAAEMVLLAGKASSSSAGTMPSV